MNAAVETSEYSTNSKIEAKRILVVDDDADFSRRVQMILAKNGYNVCCVTSGQEGLQEYHRFHPNLIILDVRMPGMNGFDVCRGIRQVSSTPDHLSLRY